MTKLGRNEPCPCGSGLKYKKCCLLREAAPQPSPKAAAAESQTFVNRELLKLQEQAAAHHPTFRLIGALVFFSTAQGDAWLLELTEQDAVRVAVAAKPVPVAVNETEEILEIGWTHSFILAGQQLVTTAYLDGTVSTHEGCPTRQIKEALEHIRRQYSRRDLESIRLKES